LSVKLEWTGKNDEVERNFKLLGEKVDQPVPQVEVTNVAAVSVATGTATTMTWSTTVHDHGGMKTSTTQLTAKVAGLYMIGTGGRWAANATGCRLLSLRKNGTLSRTGAFHTANVAGQMTWQNATTVDRLAVGDYYEVRVFQDSGGALNFDYVAGTFAPSFWMVRLAGYESGVFS
jgi:hypothetical protein